MFSIELTHRQEDKHLTSMEGRFLHHMKYECNMRYKEIIFISFICESQARMQKPDHRSSQDHKGDLGPVCGDPHSSSFIIPDISVGPQLSQQRIKIIAADAH